jgi:glycosyltransferase involved in cell wall biosynthesis
VNAYAGEARMRGLRVFTLVERGAFDWRLIRQILTIIDGQNVNIIHTHEFRSNLFGLICGCLRGVRIVSTAHGWIANTFRRRVFRVIDKFLLKFFDAIIAVSYQTKSLVTAAWVREDRVTVIQNALRVELFVPNRDKPIFRKQYGIARHALVFGNIGRLSPEKGQLEFLQAARQFLLTKPDAVFVIVGTGPDAQRLRAYVQQDMMMENVIFTGYREEMLSVYDGLDLVVQSSYTEGMPNVVLEALLMGVPVVATDVGGTSEIITHRETGILIEAGNIKSLVNSMREFVEKPSCYAEMAARGSCDIRERFDHKRRIEALSSLYKRLAAR